MNTSNVEYFINDIKKLMSYTGVEPIKFFSIHKSYFENNINEIRQLISFCYYNFDFMIKLLVDLDDYLFKLKLFKDIREKEFKIFII